MRRLRLAEAYTLLNVLKLSLICGMGYFWFNLPLLQYSQAISRMALVPYEGTFKPHLPQHFCLGYSDIIVATIADISLFLVCLGIARIVFQALWAQYVGWNIGLLYFQPQCAIERAAANHVLVHPFPARYCPLTLDAVYFAVGHRFEWELQLHRQDAVYVAMGHIFDKLRLDSRVEEEEQEEGIDHGLIPMEQKRHPPRLQRCGRLAPSCVLIGSPNRNVTNRTPTETIPDYYYHANFRICFTLILSMATQKATETPFKKTFQGMCSRRYM